MKRYLSICLAFLWILFLLQHHPGSLPQLGLWTLLPFLGLLLLLLCLMIRFFT